MRFDAPVCPGCATQAAYIKALENHVTALETVIVNSQRSLAAEGQQVKKTRAAVKAAKMQGKE